MLALIAGMGELPPALIARLADRPLVCAMDGFVPAVTPDVTFRIEHLGSFLADMSSRGVTEVCMAGAVKRPPVDPAQIDAATLPLVPRIQAAIAQGDDGALRTIIAIFEEAGFAVKAAHEIAPDLLPDAGVLTGGVITIDQKQDAVVGEQTVAVMGQDDIGQACIIRNGRVLAREGKDGTDAMFTRLVPESDPVWAGVDLLGGALGAASEWLSGSDGDPVDLRGAILFKAPKPNQDRRADLPVIGPTTAEQAVRVGLAGIVIEAGGVMVLEQDRTIATLQNAGVFLWVRPKGGA